MPQSGVAWHEIPNMDGVAALAVAALVGLAVGIEREWSGHASGPQARFAGVRTFLLLALTGGTAGLLASHGQPVIGGVLAAGAAALVVAAYAMSVRREGVELDGTTEAAALVVLALSVLAGFGQLALAAGAGALVAMALREKERLHGAIRHIGDKEMRAALQFAVLALVVLPLLPDGPYGGVVDFRPRSLWSIVLLFLGVDFAGYLARRSVGPRKGFGITGLIGGLVSSTLVTLQFSRESRRQPEHATSLAIGAIAACSVMPLRVATLTTVLNPSLGEGAIPFLLAPALVGFGAAALTWRRVPDAGEAPQDLAHANPLRLWSAVQMGVLFQVAMVAIVLARQYWGPTGVAGSAVALGLVDVDALTASMSRLADDATLVGLAARGVAIGVLTNTVVKLGIGLALGSSKFRLALAVGLGLQVVACAVGIWLA